ncbi:MAG: hypothetical protein HOK97_23130, partial [Deltaproteobacteria bacterium]|nr:hypothetical protein [Deltaproteobacteria bacterium]
MRSAITFMAIIFSTLCGATALAQDDGQAAVTPQTSAPETIALNQTPTLKPA